MSAYYNEFDRQKAAWLRELIKNGLIAPGEVDERSITDVQPSDLRGYTQCHWFAGIGIWSYALRLAGWPDDREVWTGSCPCQSFSVAGKREGFSDPRHLWPSWFRLIRECRPATVFGEQVDSAIRHGWLDLVQTNLEGEGYACGKAVLGACSVGAPHQRKRLYFVAESEGVGRERRRTSEKSNELGTLERSERFCDVSGLDNPAGSRRFGPLEDAEGDPRNETRMCVPGEGSGFSGLAFSDNAERWPISEGRNYESYGADSGGQEAGGFELDCEAGPVNGFWSDAEWIYCRDEKFRAIEPGTFPLAHGAPARVGRLRGYGDAIVTEVAQKFIESYLEVRG